MEVNEHKIRNIVKQITGRTISSKQAAAFLDLFGGDLNETINQAVRGFVTKHFSA